MNKLISMSSHQDDDRIGILHMHDSGSKNAFTDEFVSELLGYLTQITSDSLYSTILLKGLPDVFCSGASKEALVSIREGNFRVKDLSIIDRLLEVPVPVIAVMEGAAIGGGFILALLCDILIMNERMMYGANFTNLGFTPGMGCTRLLQSLVGEYIANEMMYRGRLMKGKTFRERSLVNYVLPRDTIMVKATDIALEICEKPKTTLEILKYSLSLEKKKRLLEARVQEDFMHRVSFNQPEIRDIIERVFAIPSV